MGKNTAKVCMSHLQNLARCGDIDATLEATNEHMCRNGNCRKIHITTSFWPSLAQRCVCQRDSAGSSCTCIRCSTKCNTVPHSTYMKITYHHGDLDKILPDLQIDSRCSCAPCASSNVILVTNQSFVSWGFQVESTQRYDMHFWEFNPCFGAKVTFRIQHKKMTKTHLVLRLRSFSRSRSDSSPDRGPPNTFLRAPRGSRCRPVQGVVSQKSTLVVGRWQDHTPRWW